MKKMLVSLLMLAVLTGALFPVLAEAPAAEPVIIAVPEVTAPEVSVPDIAVLGVSAPVHSLPAGTRLPDTFLITYAVRTEEVSASGSMTVQTVGRDADGRICVAGDGRARIFLPADGLYAESGSERMYTPEDLLALGGDFVSCLRKAASILSADPGRIGTDVIAGRTASVYQLTFDIGIYKQTFELAVDDETGLCLQLTNVSEFLGLSAERTIDFTCTQFITQDVELPHAAG